jgi:membrane AbrB-like protein
VRRLPTLIDPVRLRSLAIGAAGGLALGLTGMPGGWIAGAMLAVAVYALSGGEVGLSPAMRNLGFLVVGISMGSGVTPETVARLPSWPITMALVIATLPLTILIVSAFLERVAGWTRPTAVLSSMPGALSFLLALAPDTKADVPRVAIVQTMRVAILVAIIPLFALGLPEPVQAVAPTASVSLEDVLLLYSAGVGGAVLASLLNVPAGLLIGGLLVSAILHGTGLVEGQPPEWLAIFGFIVLGVLIGSRFAGTRWSQLGAIIGVSLASFVLSVSIAVAMATLGAALTDFPLFKLIVAFAPGGLEAMVVLAFALDLDPAFVAAHHLARFLLIALLAPYVLHRLKLLGSANATDLDVRS